MSPTAPDRSIARAARTMFVITVIDKEFQPVCPTNATYRKEA
jgi:hypothetical protein